VPQENQAVAARCQPFPPWGAQPDVTGLPDGVDCTGIGVTVTHPMAHFWPIRSQHLATPDRRLRQSPRSQLRRMVVVCCCGVLWGVTSPLASPHLRAGPGGEAVTVLTTPAYPAFSAHAPLVVPAADARVRPALSWLRPVWLESLGRDASPVPLGVPRGLLFETLLHQDAQHNRQRDEHEYAQQWPPRALRVGEFSLRAHQSTRLTDHRFNPENGAGSGGGWPPVARSLAGVSFDVELKGLRLREHPCHGP